MSSKIIIASCYNFNNPRLIFEGVLHLYTSCIGFLTGFDEPTANVPSFNSLPKLPNSWKG